MSKMLGSYIAREEKLQCVSGYINDYRFNAASIRYLALSNSYVIRGWCKSLNKIADIKVIESDLLEMCYYRGYEVAHTLLSGDFQTRKKKKMEQIYKEEFALLHELDNDSFSDLSLLMYVFKISPTVLKSARTKWHTKRLGKHLTGVVELEKCKHSRGDYDNPVMSPNIENYENIYRNCIIKDRYEDFILLNKEWCKFNRIRFLKADWIEKYRHERANLIK